MPRTKAASIHDLGEIRTLGPLWVKYVMLLSSSLGLTGVNRLTHPVTNMHAVQPKIAP